MSNYLDMNGLTYFKEKLDTIYLRAAVVHANYDSINETYTLDKTWSEIYTLTQNQPVFITYADIGIDITFPVWGLATCSYLEPTEGEEPSYYVHALAGSFATNSPNGYPYLFVGSGEVIK